jgi:hypothetical protein
MRHDSIDITRRRCPILVEISHCIVVVVRSSNHDKIKLIVQKSGDTRMDVVWAKFLIRIIVEALKLQSSCCKLHLLSTSPTLDPAIGT